MRKKPNKPKKAGKEKQKNKTETKMSMAVLNPTISISTLNINGLNIPSKKGKLTNQIKKKDLTTIYKRQT